MNVKICTALLALSLAVPAVSMADPMGVVDLGGIFAVGEIAQGLDATDGFKAKQNGGGGNAQGGNVVVTGDMDKTIAQAALVSGNLNLKENGGGGNNQALNLIAGAVKTASAQGAVIDGRVKLEQNRGGGNTQGVNVVNGCTTCD